MNDLINRQDAIDAVERAKTARSADGEIFCAKINAQMNIQHLPSAELKIIRCKDCVYARKINTHSNGRRNYKCYKYSMFNNEFGKTITYEVLVDDNHYCAYGEREEE